MLTKEQILTASDTHVETIHIPEWNGDVCIRVVSGAERDKFESGCLDPLTGKMTRMSNTRARFAAMVLCNEAGASIFSAADIDALSGKSALALDRILDAGLRLNGMDKTSVESAEGN